VSYEYRVRRSRRFCAWVDCYCAEEDVASLAIAIDASPTNANSPTMPSPRRAPPSEISVSRRPTAPAPIATALERPEAACFRQHPLTRRAVGFLKVPKRVVEIVGPYPLDGRRS
jgi:hypothetical protein